MTNKQTEHLYVAYTILNSLGKLNAFIEEHVEDLEKLAKKLSRSISKDGKRTPNFTVILKEYKDVEEALKIAQKVIKYTRR